MNGEGIDSVPYASDDGAIGSSATTSRQTELERVTSSTYIPTHSTDITSEEEELLNENAGVSSTNTYDSFGEMSATQ